MKRDRAIRVLFLAAEAAPFAQAGGLADVVGSLPKALRKRGLNVCVFLPRYSTIDRKAHGLRDTGLRVPVRFDGIAHVVRVFSSTLPQSTVRVFFLDHPHYEGGGDIYYQDVTNEKEQRVLQTERFLFFVSAAAAVARRLGWRPDIVHFHDWHTSSAPLFFSCPTVMTIHNLALQGVLPAARFSELLDEKNPHSIPSDAHTGTSVNLTRLGLSCATAVTTVSPTYAKEILTRPSGAGCDDLLRKRRNVLSGILNGLDTTVYDPLHDPAIIPYSVQTLPRKKENEHRLRRECRFVRPGPIFGMVTRLTEQKGIELVCSAAKQLVQWGVNLVVLGAGAPKYEALSRSLSKQFPRAVAVRIGFDTALARRIYAGSNAFLMPSKFEPCGLGQMIALRYGTVPIVRRTGGLTDTVREGKNGNGFVFRSYTVNALLSTCRRMLTRFRDRRAFQTLQEHGMRTDFSWDRSAARYHVLYQTLLHNVTTNQKRDPKRPNR